MKLVIDVREIMFDDADEAWQRVTDDPDVRGVEAVRIGWSVAVRVMEFVRENPLESELCRRIEVWFVTGTPLGEALVRAVAEVVDDLAGQVLLIDQPPQVIAPVDAGVLALSTRRTT